MSTIVHNLNTHDKKTDGKGASRALRREGLVPAIMYGAGAENATFCIEKREMTRELKTKGIFSRIFEMTVGKKKERALIKEIQFHPVTDEPLHIDFLRVNKDSRVTVSVPVTFVNREKSLGLRRGGSINVVAHFLNVICSPDNIPTHIDIDMTGLKAKDRVSVKNVKLPEGVELARKNEVTVCTILPPRGLTVAEANKEE